VGRSRRCPPGVARRVCHAGEMTPGERSSPPRPALVSAPDGPHAQLTGDLSVVVGSLHDQYDSRLGFAAVDSEIQQVADRFALARIRSYVPLFVRRFAGAKLREDCAGQPGPAARPAVTADDRILVPAVPA